MKFVQPTTIEVPVKLDTKALADLRLLLSQVGFAIDNYLASQESNTGRRSE